MNAVEYQDLIGLPHARMDCWHVVMELYLRAGVALPDRASFENWYSVTDAKQWGDVLAISKNSNGNADSCGVVVEDGKILTSLHGSGVVIVNERSFTGKILGRYRWKL